LGFDIHAQPAAAHAKQRGGRRGISPADGQPPTLTRHEGGDACSNGRSSLTTA